MNSRLLGNDGRIPDVDDAVDSPQRLTEELSPPNASSTWCQTSRGRFAAATSHTPSSGNSNSVVASPLNRASTRD